MGFASHQPGRPRLAAIVIGVTVCAATTSCASGPAAHGSGSSSSNGSSNSNGSGGEAPPITILTHGADNGNGDIFIAPEGEGAVNGPEILTITGHVVWFHPLPAGEQATDFRTQTYLGQPVLTWFQSGSDGPEGGTDEIYNDHYQPMATVRAADGDMTNFHEFLITPWNTALILADTTATANLSSIGGPSDQQVIDGIVQEIDIKTGQVLFQWNSAGHVPYRDSHLPLPGEASMPWDWFHINAVHLDTDGNLLIDARNTWTTYKVNIHTGQVIWELGGKQSSFALKAAPGQVLDHDGEIFAWQHDPEAIGGEYTLFDDESGGELLGYSRAVTVRLDLQTHVATLIKSDNQPEGLVAGAMGNAQTTSNGDLFVGWGSLPFISEFSPSGQLLFNAELPSDTSTYRAYRLPWHPGR
jgi:hypothetical protein